MKGIQTMAAMDTGFRSNPGGSGMEILTRVISSMMTRKTKRGERVLCRVNASIAMRQRDWMRCGDKNI
jgi:hypothetical protein